MTSLQMATTAVLATAAMLAPANAGPGCGTSCGGVWLNGTKLNGINLNGMRMNGPVLQGVNLNGPQANVLGGQIVAIEF